MDHDHELAACYLATRRYGIEGWEYAAPALARRRDRLGLGVPTWLATLCAEGRAYQAMRAKHRQIALAWAAGGTCLPRQLPHHGACHEARAHADHDGAPARALGQRCDLLPPDRCLRLMRRAKREELCAQLG